MSYEMMLLSLIFRAFEGKQYRSAYMKQMHASLKDCSERTLTFKVYHTPPAIVQLWKSQMSRRGELRSTTLGRRISL